MIFTVNTAVGTAATSALTTAVTPRLACEARNKRNANSHHARAVTTAVLIFRPPPLTHQSSADDAAIEVHIVECDFLVVRAEMLQWPEAVVLQHVSVQTTSVGRKVNNPRARARAATNADVHAAMVGAQVVDLLLEALDPKLFAHKLDDLQRVLEARLVLAVAAAWFVLRRLVRRAPDGRHRDTDTRHTQHAHAPLS